MKKPGESAQQRFTLERFRLEVQLIPPFFHHVYRIDTQPFFVYMYVPFTEKWYPFCPTPEEHEIDESSYRINVVLINDPLNTLEIPLPE